MGRDKQRILLLNPPGDKNYLRDGYCSSVAKGDYFFPPADLLAISGVLGDERFDVFIMDCIAEDLLPADVLNSVEANRAEAVIAQVATASKDADLRLLKEIKTVFPGIKIMVNGEYALKAPAEVMLRNSFIDAVIHDYTSAEIGAYLSGEDKAYATITRRASTGIEERSGDLGAEMIFAGIPRHDLIRKELYRLPWAKRHPVTCVITSFGCPFNCAFCVAGTYKYKKRDIESVIQELKSISGLGIKEVYFLDSLFTGDKKRTIDLSRRMLEEKIDITWSCLGRVNTYDEDVLAAMKSAGCHTIQLGVESGSDEMLKKVRKGFFVADIEKAVKMANKYGINVDGFFIIGAPGERKEHIAATIDLAKRLDFNLVSFQLAMPLKGTDFEKGSLLPDVAFDDAENAVSINENFTIDELKKLQQKANMAYYFRPAYILRQLFRVSGWSDFKLKAAQALKLLIPSKSSFKPVAGRKEFRDVLERYRKHSFRTYWYMRLKRSFYDSWMWEILYRLPSVGKIYDLGSGFGLLDILHAEMGRGRIFVQGLDMDEKRTRIARQVAGENLPVRFMIADALNVNFADADAVVVTDFFHHIPYELQNRMIERIYSALPAGGRLIIKEITGKDVDPLKYYFAFILEKLLYPFDKICYREEAEFRGYLEKLGFSRVEVKNIPPHNIILCEK